MSSRFLRNSRARAVALAVGAVTLGSLASAPAVFAKGVSQQSPTVGAPCAADGKIAGTGSTFQANAMVNAYIVGYYMDVCGPVANSTNMNSAYDTIGTTGASGDPTGISPGPNPFNGVTGVTGSDIAYNDWQNAQTGSGNGIKSMSCRVAEFGGTDLPYNATQLSQMDSTPGAANGGACGGNFIQDAPFGPNVGATGVSQLGTAKNIMSFPIGGGAVAIAANFGGATGPTGTAGVVCTVAIPTSLSLTAQQVAEINQGTINQWDDPELVQTDPQLTADGCYGPIQRVVRTDNSGTTAITMTMLNGIQIDPSNNTPANTLCNNAGVTGVTGWAGLASHSPNISWPAGCSDEEGHTAPNTIHNAGNGSPNLITTLLGTPGGIGYAELGLWPKPLPAGVVFTQLESQATADASGITSFDNLTPGSFVTPGTPGAASSCSIGARGLPGGGSTTEAVGLGPANDNWANDNTPTTQVENITYAGAGYPACGLTFDMVYTGYPTTAPAGSTGSTLLTTGPQLGLNYDQLRTMYSFFTYMFSPAGQEGATATASTNGQTYTLNYAPAAQTFDTLPTGWLDNLRLGFQQNF